MLLRAKITRALLAVLPFFLLGRHYANDCPCIAGITGFNVANGECHMLAMHRTTVLFLLASSMMRAQLVLENPKHLDVPEQQAQVLFLTTARVLGEFGAVIVVSGAVAGRTQTLTLFIQDSIENLNTTGAYAGAVILALIALVVLTVLGADSEGRKAKWRSPSDRSPSDSEMPLLSTTSTSMR